MFDLKRTTLFCLGYHFSKQKMSIYAKNLGAHGPLAPWPPGYVYERSSVQRSRIVHHIANLEYVLEFHRNISNDCNFSKLCF